jgi:putative endonuclease
MPNVVYILECADGSYYTGFTHNLERRLYEHSIGADKKSYSFHRRPVQLAWACEFTNELDARNFERQIKGWTRKKKQALIKENWEEVHGIVASERKRRERPQRET